MTDRNDHYVPTNIRNVGPPKTVEIGQPGTPHCRRVPIAMADADEFNRQTPMWWWARVDQREKATAITDDGLLETTSEHWSHFTGHRVQVDVELHTWNSRDVNDWKGRDEIRPEGEWRLYFDRTQVFSGRAADPVAALRRIADLIPKLLEFHHIKEWTPEGLEEIVGRQIYYQNTPAVITWQSIAHEGRIGIEAAEGHQFPPPPYVLEEEGMMHDDDKSVVTTIFDPAIWWWRK